MMTIHKLTAGDGYTYLTRHVAGGDVDRRRGQTAGDYYTAEGNPPGGWLGKGITALGLQPGDEVTEAQMRALFGHGLHPDADAMIAEYQAAHVRAGMTDDQLAAITEQARKHATLGRSLPVYRALDPYEQRVGKRLAGIAEEMARPPTTAEEKKIRREEATRQRAAVAGYDAVFAPVKSAALIWALDEREGVRQAVRAAHEEARNSAIAMLEQHAAYTRTGRGGIAQIETRGLVAVAFDHYDSRCGDPNLHTHVVLSNKIQGVDGRWRSLDARVLYEMTVAASEHYNTTFETALQTRLGVRFTTRPATTGNQPIREIDGLPTSWITLFSRRRSAVEARYDELLRDYRQKYGRDPTRTVAHKLARHATLDTRDGKKPPRSLAAMRADWHEQVTTVHRGDPQNVLDHLIAAPTGTTVTSLPDATIDELADQVARAVAEQKSTWTRWNIHAQTQRCLRHGSYLFAAVEDLKRAADAITERALSPRHSIVIDAPAVIAEPAALRRTDGESVFTRHGGTRYTSQLILDAEQRLIAAATVPAVQALEHNFVNSSLEVFQARYGRLDAGQQALVTAFATADTRISVGIGAAGTGKTTAMRAFADVTASHGRRLIPLATSAASAAVLGSDLNQPAENLHKFLYEHGELDGPLRGAEANAMASGAVVSPARRAFQVRPGDVILVDEAGMAGTLLLDRLGQLASRHGASVRLLGDWRQLGAVESGGALRLIAAEAGAVELSALHRFANPAEAAATIGLRTGDTAALDFYEQHERIVGGSRQAMIDAVYQAWKTDMLAGQVTLMIASTNADVAALSARARTERVTAGQVESQGVLLRDSNQAGAGDWIVTRDNNRTITTFRGKDFVKNGDAWTVVKRHRDGSLRVRHHDHAGLLTLPADYVARHVQLLYATTTHRAQGATVDTAHLLVDDQLTRENLYVAMSRARRSSHAYVATWEMLPLDEDHRMDRPRHDPHARAAREVLEQVLAREGAQLSATETIRHNQNLAASLATLAPRYLYAAEQAATGGYRRIIGDMFSPETASLVLDDPALAAVVRALRYGEHHGWQPEQILATAARRGTLTSADTPAQLLAWRCKTTVDEHPVPTPLTKPNPADTARYSTLVAQLTGLDPGQLRTETALATPAALTIDPVLADRRRPDHYQSIIVGVLGSDLTLHAAGEPAWPALAAAVRRAEHAGHDPAEVLHRACAQRDLHTAASLSEVLAWRIGRYLDRHPTSRADTTDRQWNQLAWTLKTAEHHHGIGAAELLGDISGQADLGDVLRYAQAAIRRTRRDHADPYPMLPTWLPVTGTTDPGHADDLHHRLDQISTRVRQLADAAAADRPAWTTVFGTPPDNPETHTAWLRQLGNAAAYRDQHQVQGDDPAQPLGPYIEPGRAGHHAYWKAAQAVITACQLASQTGVSEPVDHDLHRIVVDIYTNLPDEQRQEINAAMQARIGPLWLGSAADPDTAAVQPTYVGELVATLRQQGLLTASHHAPEGERRHTGPSVIARQAEHLAKLATEQFPKLPTEPELIVPDHPNPKDPQLRL